MKADVIVDARYRSCPGPLLSLAEAVIKARPGQVIKLLATDPGAPSDVGEWASSTGHKVLKIDKLGDIYEIYVEVRL